jgi:peptidoglycan glycosyltransferase
VNRQLNRLAVASIVLLVALVVATTYWQTWASAGLQDKQDNAIQRVVQFSVARGLIQAAGGKATLAANKKVKQSGQTLYFRRYPQHGFAAQTLGYSTASRSQAGLERSMNDYLTGSNTNLSDAFKHVLDRLGNATVHGNNLELTIKPKAQRLAQQLLGDRCGAIVAMNPQTGAVYVMASSPTYDPNLIDKPGGYAKVLNIRGACGSGHELLNRATQDLYTHSYTFKIIRPRLRSTRRGQAGLDVLRSRLLHRTGRGYRTPRQPGAATKCSAT